MIDTISNIYYTSTIIKPKSMADYGALAAVAASFFLSEKVGLGLTAAYLTYKWADHKVNTIYHPAIAKTPPNLSNSEKSKPGNVLGFVNSENQKTKQIEPIYISYLEEDVNGERSKVNFFAKTVCGDKDLGWAQARPIYTQINGEYGNPELLFPEFSTEHYAKEDKVELIGLFNTAKTHKYVGYYLIKAVMQHFKDQYGNRLDTDSAYQSHPFYYRLGFRTINAKTNFRIALANLIPSLFGKTGHLGAKKMYFDKRACKDWMKEIQIHPITH